MDTAFTGRSSYYTSLLAGQGMPILNFVEPQLGAARTKEPYGADRHRHIPGFLLIHAILAERQNGSTDQPAMPYSTSPPQR